MLSRFVPPLAMLACLIRFHRKRSEPKFPIIYDSSPPPKQQKEKVLVVGAGIIGCNIVYHLSQHLDPLKSQVTIIDSHDAPCKGCSEMNGRHINLNTGHNYSLSYSAILKQIFEKDQKKSIHINPLAPFETGSLRFFIREYSIHQNEEALEQIIKIQKILLSRTQESFWEVIGDLEKELGSDILKRIKVKDTIFAKSYPFDKVPEQIKNQGFLMIKGEEAKQFCRELGLTYSEEDQTTIMKLSNCKTVQTNQLGLAFLEFAQSKFKNVTVRTKTRMKGWISDKQGKIIGVQTNQGAIYADVIIVCAGMMTKFMILPLGYILPLIAGKGYSMNYSERKEGNFKLPPLDSNFFDFHSSLYYNKTPGEIRQSGLFEVTTYDDLEIEESKISRMKKSMNKTFNMDLNNFDQRKWTQLRPCLPQDLPVAGSLLNYRNIFIATGTGSKGTVLSNPLAEYLVAQITGKRQEVSPIYRELGDSIKPEKYLKLY